MDFDPTDLDPGFITVDADASYGDILDLMGELSPSSVVIREASGFADLYSGGEDEDVVFYVLDAGALLALDAPRTTLIGRLLQADPPARAPVIDTMLRLRGGLGDLPPEQRGQTPAAVVLSDGIPDGLAHAAPGGDQPAAADPGQAVGVAVDYPRSVAVESTMSLLIRLTVDLSGPDVIPFVANVGDVIDVFVSPRRGFVVEGPPDGTLTVTAETEPLPIQVKLRATTVGAGSVTVYAFRAGAPLGALTITPEVLAEGPEEASRASAAATLGDDSPADADLQLVILEQSDRNDEPELQFLLTGRDPDLGLNLKPFGPTSIGAGPGGYFTDLYREIEKLPVESEQDKAEATERLHAIGTSLFTDLLPEDLRTLLWRLRERIKTVWIQSAEPYIPWEICRLQGTAEDGTIVEGEFFSEAFELTRWIPGIARRTELTLSSVGVIVPSDSGLDNAPAEKEMLHGLARPGRSVTDISPTYLDVRSALASARYDGLHFSGHGKFPDHSNPAKAEIELEGRKKLRPSDISGVAANLGRRKPLVFLNACQVGRQAPGLTGVGGWAVALLRNGASAFVGTHWEVTDDLALTFASRFYESLEAGETIAAAARTARVAIRETGDPTWLAYTVFADPGAKLAT